MDFQSLLNRVRGSIPRPAVDAARGAMRGLQSIPTALNPFATRTPTTAAGRVGKAVNPLNPTNFLGLGASAMLPGNNPIKGTVETLLFTPGGPAAKLGAALLTEARPVGDGTLEAARRRGDIESVGGTTGIGGSIINDPRGRYWGDNPGSVGPNGKYWAGPNWGYQSAGSFNKLFNTNLPAERTAPPAPTLPPPIGTSSARTGATGTFAAAAATPVERAYQQEASRVAQMTAQNPDLQRYEVARRAAVAFGATPEQVQSAEDIGMQIWRQKYQGTPMAAQGGAVGSFNPLMDRTFGYQAGMAPGQMVETQKIAAPIPVAEGAAPYQTGDLGTRATLETGYDPAAYGLTPERIEEMKKKLLQQRR